MTRYRLSVRDAVLGVGALFGGLSLVVAALAVALDLRLLTFRSGSMEPSIGTGALAVARTVPATDVRVGDVVSVPTATGSRVTHRVVAVEHHGDRALLELRGDANRVADAAPYDVPSADRVLFSVPFLGRVGAALGSPVGLFALGLYAAWLVRELLPRRPAGGSRKGGTRRSAPAAALAVLVAVGVVGTLGQRSAGTLAAWADAASTTGSTFATGSVPAPATFTCGLVGFFSVNFSWASVPGATSYTLHYGAGGASTTTVAGTSATVVTAISGGTAWVQANRAFGATTWTSGPSPTRSYSVLAISICS